MVNGLQTQERGQLLMACGTGKTLTSLWIKEGIGAHRTLVLLPSLSLLSQTLREWTANSKTPFNWICVCSDQSVAKQDRTSDAWIENISELAVPVTNDPDEIRRFLHGEAGGVVFCTYQSSPLVAEAQTDQITPAFDLAFADEAHRCAGKVSAAFGCILNDAQIRSKKRLFMTATPRILSNQIKSKAVEEEIEVASMDDKGRFGEVLHRLDFSEAIKRDLLTDYRVVVVGVDDPEIQAQIINRPLSITDNDIEIDYGTLADHISLAKSIRDFDLQRIITFHGRVKGARKFAKDHPRVIDWLPSSSKADKAINTDYVSGGMTSLERNTKIGQLRNVGDGEIRILSNAKCLSEGVDVPTLDGIAFIDPRSSQVDIIQAVGRAIRKSDTKEHGYIILPVYLGDTVDMGESILASRFKYVWEIILALRSQDDSLAATLDQMRVELGRRVDAQHRSKGLEKIVFDLPKRVQNIIGDHIHTILVRGTTSSWMEYYGRLVDYSGKKGHARPRKGERDEENFLVGDFVDKQRQRKSLLDRDRIALLEALPGWTWNPRDDDWIVNYQETLRYLRDRSTTNIPRGG